MAAMMRAATFEGLNRKHPLRPIRTDAELDAAMSVLDQMTGRDSINPDQLDYIASLSTLVRDYEATHHPLDADDAGPVHERLAYLCELHDMTAADLGRLLGNRALGSKLLRGEREPSKAHIRTLCDRFKLGPGYFL